MEFPLQPSETEQAGLASLSYSSFIQQLSFPTLSHKFQPSVRDRHVGRNPSFWKSFHSSIIFGFEKSIHLLCNCLRKEIYERKLDFWSQSHHDPFLRAFTTHSRDFVCNQGIKGSCENSPNQIPMFQGLQAKQVWLNLSKSTIPKLQFSSVLDKSFVRQYSKRIIRSSCNCKSFFNCYNSLELEERLTSWLTSPDLIKSSNTHRSYFPSLNHINHLNYSIHLEPSTRQ